MEWNALVAVFFILGVSVYVASNSKQKKISKDKKKENNKNKSVDDK